MLLGLNHLTLTVSDVQASVDFYQGLLGMNLRKQWDSGAYLECGSLWLCLSQDDARELVGSRNGDYTHYAFSIDEDNFEEFVSLLEGVSVTFWKENESEGLSAYFLDPDGHKLEAHVGNLESRLALPAYM
ncbi:MAG: VOC family protein [Coriobacteriia bacterium]|nr:VOC family protein [Coriobacteriia bacterium]